MTVTRKGLTDIYTDPALAESVTISRLAPWRDEPDTIANRRASSLRSVGYAIINRRLARLARGADAPFRGASYGSGDIFEDARITSLTVSSADGEWQKGVLAATRDVNQALTYGFTPGRGGRTTRQHSHCAGKRGQDPPTRGNTVFAGAALAVASDERVPVTPEWQLAEFAAARPRHYSAGVWQAVLADAAPMEDPLIRFEGRAAPEGGEAALRGAFAQGMALPDRCPG